MCELESAVIVLPSLNDDGSAVFELVRVSQVWYTDVSMSVSSSENGRI